MKEIGGFFELELNDAKEFHTEAIKLNLGRTAFEYILKAKKVQKVYLPFYTCDVMLEPLRRTSTNYEFYYIDNNLEPVFDYDKLKESDYFLYTNYFGLKDNFVKQISTRIKNLIIDNSQAFFSKPLPGVDTFYSPRKFFGIPDGGYLYTHEIMDENFEIDNSFERFGHLIGRIEKGVEESFLVFKENDQKLIGQPIKQMSKITQRLLQNINYGLVAKVRKRNFAYLHEKIGKKNCLNLDLQKEMVPMVYPYLDERESLRGHLIKNKVFVAQYWPNIKKWCDPKSFEYYLFIHLVNIPIDQRITKENLDFIIQHII